MASKKTGKKKGRKKARTAAQKAATKRLVAMNKAKKKTGKKRGKKSKKKVLHQLPKTRGGWRQHSVGRKAVPTYHSNLAGPYRPGRRYKPSIGEQFAGERGGARFHGPVTPTQALEAANREIARLKKGHGKRHSKKATKHHHSGKKSGVITAASILKGAKSQNLKLYVCAGKRMSGCGGGKKGAHVVGHLRA